MQNKNTQLSDLSTEGENYREASRQFRLEKRDLWGKIILLSSAVLGLSVTMFSNEYLSTVSPTPLKIGWSMFLVTILSGLSLLKKESEFEQSQNLANLAQKLDQVELKSPTQTQDNKDRLIASIYLHGTRHTPPKENPFSEYAAAIYQQNRTKLTSWKMVKNPEKFYSYSHMRTIKTLAAVFYSSFILAMLFIIFSVL